MKRYIAIIFILTSGMVNAQLIFSKKIKQSESASSEDKSLFLIDFWATWCAPCIHVSTYLNELQKQFPDKLYIVSLTNESPDVVEKFLKRHHTSLAVSIDYDKKNFKNYDVNILPYSILLNANGQVVWEGTPSDLKASNISYYLQRNKRTAPIEYFFSYIEYKTEQRASISIDSDYELQKIEDKEKKGLSISQHNKYKIIKGNFHEILTYLLKIAPSQLIFQDSSPDDNYRLIINNYAHINQIDLANELLEKEGLSYKKESVIGERYMVYTFNPNLFWDKDEIKWGDDNASFLISDQEITADNVSFIDLIYQLSTIKKIPFVLIEPTKDKKLHDWEIHYKFDDLMKASLQDYGIQIEKSYGDYPIYRIIKEDTIESSEESDDETRFISF